MSLLDWLWNTLIAPWPDLEVGKIEVRDLANICLWLVSIVIGGLGARLAYLSIKMGREQSTITERQIEIAQELKTLLKQLGKLEAKQAEIAEKQHTMFERERSKKAILKLEVPTPANTNLQGPTIYNLFLLNDGDKAEGGYWYLGIPRSIRGRVSVRPALGNEEVLLPADYWEIVGTFDQPLVGCFSDDYVLLKFRAITPVEPGERAPCAELSVTWEGEARDQSRRIFWWFTRGAKRFPEKGMRKLRLYRPAEAVFKPQYGGIVLPEDDPDGVSDGSSSS